MPGRSAAQITIEHVFERFHTSGTATGSGIGLTLARELVQAHSGAILMERVESESATVTSSSRFTRVCEGWSQADAPE